MILMYDSDLNLLLGPLEEARSMCFAAKGRLQGWAAKLLRARRKSRFNADLGQICLAANSYISLVNVLNNA
jgi:hypothetical protein